MSNKEFIRKFWMNEDNDFNDITEMIMKTECRTVKQAFYECSRDYIRDEHTCLDLLTTYKECRRIYLDIKEKKSLVSNPGINKKSLQEGN